MKISHELKGKSPLFAWGLLTFIVVASVGAIGSQVMMAESYRAAGDRIWQKIEPVPGAAEPGLYGWELRMTPEVYEKTLQEAEKEFRSAIVRFPFHGGYYLRLARCLERQGDQKGAKSNYQKAAFLGFRA